jgi:hypothetical protein
MGNFNNSNYSETSSPTGSRKESTHNNGNKKGMSKKKDEKKEFFYSNYNEQPVYPAKYTDSDNSEDEGMEDYKVGGYHPVHVG